VIKYRNSGIIGILALGISLLAFISSMRSCSIASKSLNLSIEQFQREQLVVWDVIVNKDNDEMLIKPTTDEITLQGATLYYPPELNVSECMATPPSYSISTYRISLAIGDHLRKSYPKYKNKYLVGVDSVIPIVIDSRYTTKGKLFFEKATYFLRYEFVLSDENGNIPLVKVIGLAFVGRLSYDTDPCIYLQELWRANKGFIKSAENE